MPRGGDCSTTPTSFKITDDETQTYTFTVTTDKPSEGDNIRS